MKLNFKKNGGIIDFFFPIKKKLRIEAISNALFDGKGIYKVNREFCTFRSFIVHYWYELIYPFRLWKQLFEIDPIGNWMLNPERGAIAIDNYNNSGDKTSSPWTFSHTCTGSNLVLVASTAVFTPNTLNSVTYAAAAMTQIATANNNNYKAFSHYKLSPATGANNVVMTFSSTGNYGSTSAISFSGADTSAIGNSNQGTGNGTSSSQNVTASANSYVVDCEKIEGGGSSLTVGANQTQIHQTTGGDGIEGSSYEQGTGTVTMSWSWTGSVKYAMTVVEVKELVTTAIKTWDGLATASHKTHNGSAVASRKKWNGLA